MLLAVFFENINVIQHVKSKLMKRGSSRNEMEMTVYFY
jgi:hypothetical protein